MRITTSKTWDHSHNHSHDHSLVITLSTITLSTITLSTITLSISFTAIFPFPSGLEDCCKRFVMHLTTPKM